MRPALVILYEVSSVVVVDISAVSLWNILSTFCCHLAGLQQRVTFILATFLCLVYFSLYTVKTYVFRGTLCVGVYEGVSF